MRALTVNAEWSPRAGFATTTEQERDRYAASGSQVWRNPEWSLQDIPEPEIVDSDDVILRVKSCGMCGTDLHMYETDDDGYMLLGFPTRLPAVVGHEFAGEIVEVGKAVTRYRVGDAVAVEGVTWCGTCAACIQGLQNQCTNAEYPGLTSAGGFAQFARTKERYCWSLNGVREKVSEDKLWDIGAITEPTSVAYESIFGVAGGFKPGSYTAVFGCGPIGLAAVELMRAAGAARIIAVETSKERQELATLCGADVVLDPGSIAAAGATVAEEILVATDGKGANFTLEASGFQEAVMPSISASLAVGGKVSIVGMDSKPAPIMASMYQMRAGSIYAALGHCGGPFGLTIALHEAGRIDTTKLITSRFAVADAMAAIERATLRQDAKIILTP